VLQVVPGQRRGGGGPGGVVDRQPVAAPQGGGGCRSRPGRLQLTGAEQGGGGGGAHGVAVRQREVGLGAVGVWAAVQFGQGARRAARVSGVDPRTRAGDEFLQGLPGHHAAAARHALAADPPGREVWVVQHGLVQVGGLGGAVAAGRGDRPGQGVAQQLFRAAGGARQAVKHAGQLGVAQGVGGTLGQAQQGVAGGGSFGHTFGVRRVEGVQHVVDAAQHRLGGCSVAAGRLLGGGVERERRHAQADLRGVWVLRGALLQRGVSRVPRCVAGERAVLHGDHAADDGHQGSGAGQGGGADRRSRVQVQACQVSGVVDQPDPVAGHGRGGGLASVGPPRRQVVAAEPLNRPR